MRFTNSLLAQHLGWYFKKHWRVQGVRVPRDDGAKNVLAAMGYNVKEAEEIATEKSERIKFELIGPYPPPKPIVNDSCYVFNDSNVLLEGISQAQVLLKTLVVNEMPKKLQESLKNIQISKAVERNVQQAILVSHIFDAEQEKLPIVKIPERPMVVLPRTYGITHPRRNRLLISKLLFECEKMAGRSVAIQRKILKNLDFLLTLEKDDKKLQFDIHAETMISSKNPLSKLSGVEGGELPDLYPLCETISIPKRIINPVSDSYPIKSSLYGNPHTIFVNFFKDDVKNLHETPITDTQYKSRNMLKAFTVAASRARQLDRSAQDLKEPIVVQSIQTDGRTFHFGIFQLNTLNLSGLDGKKNYWFHLDKMDLFNECGMKHGKPVLEGYNKDVFSLLTAFYNNS